LNKKTSCVKHKSFRKLSFSGGLTRILAKAQRESAQHPKSNWGKIQTGEIPPVAKSRGPNSDALAYAECAMLT